MKNEIRILFLFLAIIVLSGGLIFIIQAGNSPSQTESDLTQNPVPSQMPPRPDQAKIKQQISEMEEHLEHSPNDFELLVSLGNAHYDINEPPKAIEYYEKALKIKSDAGVLVDLGSMYRQTGNPDKAIELFNKAIGADPKLPQAYFNLGLVQWMEKGDPKAAVISWKKYLELDPNSQARGFLQAKIDSVLGTASP